MGKIGDLGMSENVGYIPNEIAIFHRDNDQQNHWVIGVLTIFRHTHFCVFFWMFPSSAEVFILLVINILNTGIGFIARDLTNALVAKARMVRHGYGMVCLICDSDLPL